MKRQRKSITILCLGLLIITIPMLVFNLTAILKGLSDTRELPDIFGYFPLVIENDCDEVGLARNDLIICKKPTKRGMEPETIVALENEGINGSEIHIARMKSITRESEMKNVIGSYTGLKIMGLGFIVRCFSSTEGVLAVLALLACFLIPKEKSEGEIIFNKERKEV